MEDKLKHRIFITVLVLGSIALIIFMAVAFKYDEYRYVYFVPLSVFIIITSVIVLSIVFGINIGIDGSMILLETALLAGGFSSANYFATESNASALRIVAFVINTLTLLVVNGMAIGAYKVAEQNNWLV